MPGLHTYRMSDDADDVFGDHCERLAERWGGPGKGFLLTPIHEPTEQHDVAIYAAYTRGDARRFAALVRDARHYLEVHPHFGDDMPGLDAKVVRQFVKLEAALQSDCGGIDSMQQVERWFRRAAKTRKRNANPLAALAVIAAAVVMVVWMVRSCG